MTAQLADNALVQQAGARAQAISQALRRVPLDFWRKAIIVLALFWACHSLAKLFWVLYPVPELAQPSQIAQPLASDVSSPSSGVNIELLQAINLGGSQASEATQESPVPESDTQINTDDLVETQLNLKLQGIVASSDESKGKAIIADGKKQALYQVGETLPQGRNVKLAKVLNDKVIIDNNGRFESLMLYDESDFKGSSSSSRRATTAPVPERRSGGVNKAPEREETASDERRSVPPPDGSTATISREKLKATSINEVVRFSLHQENGQVMGYRIRPGRDRETFDALGLKTNDIVTTVNGIAITDRSQLREMYKTMRSATSAELEVNRDGSIMPISITLDTEGE